MNKCYIIKMDRKFCIFNTKKGRKCKNKIKTTNDYCHIHLRNDNKINIKICFFKLIPNEIISSIYKMLDLQSSINLSRTDKRNHEVFKYYLLEIYMDNINIYMYENRLKNNNDFESIFYLYIYHIKKRGFSVNNSFNKYMNTYYFKIYIFKNELYIRHNTCGIFIYFNYEELCYIDPELCKFNDILKIIDKIYNLKDQKYNINNLFNYIKSYINNIMPIPEISHIISKLNMFYKMRIIKNKNSS